MRTFTEQNSRIHVALSRQILSIMMALLNEFDRMTVEHFHSNAQETEFEQCSQNKDAFH